MSTVASTCSDSWYVGTHMIAWRCVRRKWKWQTAMSRRLFSTWENTYWDAADAEEILWRWSPIKGHDISLVWTVPDWRSIDWRWLLPRMSLNIIKWRMCGPGSFCDQGKQETDDQWGSWRSRHFLWLTEDQKEKDMLISLISWNMHWVMWISWQTSSPVMRPECADTILG